MKITNEAIDELEAIRGQTGGLLRPVDVLEHAQDESSALHHHFTWDDTEAARLHRVREARDLIVRVRVSVQRKDGKVAKVRAYTSLDVDRLNGRGYRATVDVLSDAGLRARMLETALAEVESLRKKYSDLEELIPVFRAADAVRAAAEPRATA